MFAAKQLQVKANRLHFFYLARFMLFAVVWFDKTALVAMRPQHRVRDFNRYALRF
jgi:hypothetical protein